MSGSEKGKVTIREALKEKDEELHHRIEAIWANARELQERQRSKEQHQQGSLHCEAVENNLGKIISDDEKCNRFSPLELFLLSAAACYHDAGKSDDFDEGHALVVMRDIYSHPEKYHLSDPEGKVLSYIIGSHDIDEVFNETPETYPIAINEDIHVKLLSALFRLADVLHTDNTRIPHIIVGDAKKEDDKTKFRKLVQGWGFNDKSQIMLTAAPEDLNDVNIVAKGISMMQKQIECIAPILRSEGFPYEIISSCDYRGMKWKAEIENKRNLIEMDFYTENEAEIFKGRDVESKGLLNKVIGSSISLLIGNSGVGKTSLIRAGLFAKLSKMGWKCIWTRPMNPAPLVRILNDINAKLPVGYESNDIISSIKKLSEEYGTIDVIIAIDQFEDILRAPQPMRETLGKILLRVYGKSFGNIHILLSYRGDFEPEINSFLDNSGIINPSRFPLLGLDHIGAHDALRSIFEANNVGISDKLLDIIINELEKVSEHSRLHPPFIQIVASSLINLAESSGGVITEDLYKNAARSVENIIGTYLINRLNEFGDINSTKRINIESILKELVRDRAKEQKTKDELQRYLNFPASELQELLDILVNKRLVRHLGNDNYEIIHDYLASRVEEMIKDEERPLRGARDILRIKAQHYRYMPTPSLLETHEMVLLYSMKESVKPTIQEKELLMFSYLAGNGPVWWWFKEDSEILRTFIKKALASIFSKVRIAAILAFEQLGTRDDLLIIKEMLKDPDSNVRLVAVRVFEKLGNHDDLPIIKEMLKDADSSVRAVAVKVFEKIGTRDDILSIKGILTDSDSSVRVALISAFKKLGTHDDIQLIKDMLFDSNSGVRDAVLSAFEKLGNHDDLPSIKDMLKERNRSVRIPAVMAFVKLGTHDDIPALKNMLNDRARGVREAAITAFEKLGNHDDIPIIKNMLQDIAKNVRTAAVKVLGKLGTHDDLPIVIGMLKDENSNVRFAAVEAFEKLVIREDFQMIIEMLEGYNYYEKRAATTAFEKLATREDIPVIIDMLKKYDSEVKIVAVRVLEKLVTHKDLIMIRRLLKDSDSDVRLAAIKVLEKLGTHTDIPIVIGFLKDEDLKVRLAAIEAFEKLGTHEDLLILKDFLKDENSSIENAILEIFKKLGNENDLLEISKLYTHSRVYNNEFFKCIVAMDKKFYSPFEIGKDTIIEH